MYYYEVLVGDLQYHGKSALTYASEAQLLPGSVVRIALRNRSVLGIVLKTVPEPSFTAKPIAAIAPVPPMPKQLLRLIDWLYEYYPSPFGGIVRQFLPPSTVFPRKKETRNTKHETRNASRKPLPTLTAEQSAALAAINDTGYHLLHGVTGSGKSRVYLELARRALEAGKSAIILTPEIGLTAQLTRPFEEQFSGHVYVLHSRLTAAQRRDIWYEIIAATAPVIVIGPRSALFAPVQGLGLLVIDESHDQAYKSETAPRYRSERVAAKLADLHGACFVSGSATPNIDEYYMARAKNKPVISLTQLAGSHESPLEMNIVDLRDRSQLSRSTIMTYPLLQAMQHALSRHEQILMFLNRRGTAGSILCATCGWRAVCEHCDIALTYHSDTHAMRCHTCGRSRRLPNGCPDCGETDIRLKTIGTKAVVDEVTRFFPSARIARFDADTAKSEQLEAQTEALRNGAIDIIVGTQMITKGLDLPKLAVVGVLNADSSLLIPDYTANERTFQLLMQVIGRAARGHRAGTVLVQTYTPDHPTILAAIQKNWKLFYDTELRERKLFTFPPYVFTAKLTCARATNESAQKTAMKLKQQIENSHPGLNVEGPSPAFHPRESGKYKWQLIVKSAQRQTLVDIARDLPSGWTHDLDPINLL